MAEVVRLEAHQLAPRQEEGHPENDLRRGVTEGGKEGGSVSFIDVAQVVRLPAKRKDHLRKGGREGKGEVKICCLHIPTVREGGREGGREGTYHRHKLSGVLAFQLL